MKIATALLLVLCLAACRGEDPDQAPPIGAAPVSSTGSGTAGRVDVATPADVAPSPSLRAETATLDVHERSRLYRRAAAQARQELDMAWNRCGTLDGDRFSRCRDEAVVLYDAAMTAARVEYGDDIADRGALIPGTLDTPDALAVIQVNGIRG